MSPAGTGVDASMQQTTAKAVPLAELDPPHTRVGQRGPGQSARPPNS